MTRRIVFSSLKTGINTLTVRALLMYFVISVIVTYPLIFHLDIFVTNAIDPLLYVWNLHHNFLSFTSSSRNFLDTNMFYPTTNTIAYSDHLFGQSFLLLPFFVVIQNPLIIQNIYILSTFILAAFGMYLLCFHFTKSFWPAFLSGVIYTLSLYHIDHAGQVPTASIQWLPFIFLFLFKAYESKRQSDILLFWLFFTLNFLSTLYYGLFILIPLAIFALVNYKSWKFFLKCLSWGIPFFVVILITSYPYVLFALENPTVKRSLEESGQRSAKAFDYFTFRFIHDRALFLGIPTIILGLFSLFKPTNKKVVLFFFLSGILSLLFSLGPYYDKLPLPYYLLYKLVPVFQAIRVPARFGIIAIACFSVLAGLGMFSLFKYVKNTLVQKIILIGMFFLVALQYLQYPLRFTTVPKLTESPIVYTWLKNQPDGVVLELPLKHGYNSNPIEEQVGLSYEEITENDNYIAETYRLYFSTIHQKKMINGYSSYFPTTYQDIASGMEKFPDSIDQIKKYNVTYVIVHTAQYGERWTDIEKRIIEVGGLELIQDFNTDLVYKVL